MSENYQTSEFILPFFIILAIYLIILGFIGYYASRNTKTLADFFVLSGKAGAIVSGFAYFASQYSISTFMGVPAITFATGFAGMSVSIPGIAFSMIIPALFVGRKLLLMRKKFGYLTMSDYLEDRYESKILKLIHAVLIVVFLIALMGAQTVGAGIILNTFTGLPEWIGVVSMGIIVVLYCMFGGMKGAMMTDVIQGFLMVTTAVVTFIISVKAGGGMENITAQLAEKSTAYLSHPGVKNNYSWTTYVSMILLWSFFTIGQPTLFTKFFAMKNYSTLFKAVILGTLGMLLSATLIEWSGVNAIVSLGDLSSNDFIVPTLLRENLDPIFASLLIAGIFSAGMSTIDALLVVATGGITRDIYQNIINPKASEKTILKLSIIVTVIVGALGVLVGLSKPDSIFGLIKFAFGGLGVWVAPIILGIYWKKSNAIGAISAVIIGELIYILSKLGVINISFGLDPLIVSWAVTFVLMLVICRFTTSVSSKTIERHFDNLLKI